MRGIDQLPSWLALLIAVLLLFGSVLTLIGAFGPLRLSSFYARVHPPTLGGTLGGACILVASMLYFSVLKSRPVLHELLLLGFLFFTTPMTLLLLVRAALHRDRLEGNSPVPGFDALDTEEADEPQGSTHVGG